MRDKDAKTLAVMIANRAADIEATKELKKRSRLDLALGELCRALRGKGKGQDASSEL